MARIAVGGLPHETETFAPQRVTRVDFIRNLDEALGAA